MSSVTKNSIPRPEHPRPDFMRDTFLNLNGTWQFAFDDQDHGVHAGWMNPGVKLEREIVVPFCYQSKMSGIGPTDEIHPVMWYRRAFIVPQEMRGRRILLRFGAVDFEAAVYINGRLAGTHKGGYTPFALDITPLLCEGENDLCVRVQDEPDCTQPRGKQYWDRGLMGCWYTPVSGIWQTVYLEAVGEYGLRQIHVTPDIDRHMFTAEIALDRRPQEQLELELTVSYEGSVKRTVRLTSQDRITRVPVDMIARADLDPIHIWAPDKPALYDLKVRVLKGGEAVDTVTTYFGMRKVEVREGKVYLNNCPVYQRLILDQGYWPDSLITPPSDEAIQEDLRYTLAFGYNGARKHQKLEDPRYYYWADKMGLLIWGEVPSAYDFSDETVANLADTLLGFIDRDFNHPSIITWVPMNESWGVRQIYTDKRQQATARMLYHITKAADGTRLCSSNDGWEQVITDICALHDYAAEKADMADHFASREDVERHACDWRPCYAQGETPTGKEAFMVTEYGGIAFLNVGIQGEMGGMQTWGYHDKVTDEEAFFARFKGVTDAIREIPYCQGYCYTQLTDVMQEINGLLTPDRQPKMDVARFAALNQNPPGKTNQVI
ncbi:MAG: glycoside hydrolase family 2 TIM barrel-domain containing protein [Clostridia bacterium]|nr:glycoside hydrolase family 2 TIM barrel-domain containing protein [Clostridia bacterium]